MPPWEKYQQSQTPEGPWSQYGSISEPSLTPQEAYESSAIGRLRAGSRGPLDVGLKIFGSPETKQSILEAEQARQRGMEKQYGPGSTDWMGLLGSAVPATAIGVVGGKVMPAVTLGQRVLSGMTQGGILGGLQPITGKEELSPEKVQQVATGTAVGGAVPLVTAGVQALGRGLGHLWDIVAQEPKEVVTKYQREIIGPQNIQKVGKALTEAKELIPGSKPTASQVVAGMPEGSPIQAHEAITARTPGGVSAQFGERKLEQEAARQTAAEARDVATAPMRAQALQRANAGGGVPTNGLIDEITTMQNEPGKRTSDVVQKTLGAIKEKLKIMTNDQGKIDAEDLYTIRKEMGNTIKIFAKETGNWDKKLTGGLERDIQKSIDDAIETAGGTGWKDYLSEYSGRSQAIAEDLARAKLALKPVQRTRLQGGVNLGQELNPYLPQMLSRPMMLANFAMRQLGRNVEPAIDAEAAARYLNPAYMGEELMRSGMPSRYQAIIEALMQQAPGLAATAMARRP